MIWQDVVIAVGQWLFAIALIPTLRGKEKPALMTSMLTGTVLAVIFVTFLTLSLYVAALAIFANTIIWATLAYQKWRQIKATNDTMKP